MVFVLIAYYLAANFGLILLYLIFRIVREWLNRYFFYKNLRRPQKTAGIINFLSKYLSEHIYVLIVEPIMIVVGMTLYFVFPLVLYICARLNESSKFRMRLCYMHHMENATKYEYLDQTAYVFYHHCSYLSSCKAKRIPKHIYYCQTYCPYFVDSVEKNHFIDKNEAMTYLKDKRSVIEYNEEWLKVTPNKHYMSNPYDY